ncbi:dihydroneopterin aldolase [bacterium]|nr:dihydroneopterin aldolase [bacterium]
MAKSSSSSEKNSSEEIISRSDGAIRILGMVFQANHGCGAAEKEVGATFRVDVELMTDISKAAQLDSLSHTIDVSAVYTIVKSILEGPSVDLIETLAWKIAKGISSTFEVETVTVNVHKDRAPMAGVTSGYEVEVTLY